LSWREGFGLLPYQGVNFTGTHLFGGGWGWTKVMGFRVHALVVTVSEVRTINSVDQTKVLARVATALRVPRYIQFSWHVSPSLGP
jgi:hypothetical protein